jgi:hypothetical protein
MPIATKNPIAYTIRVWSPKTDFGRSEVKTFVNINVPNPAKTRLPEINTNSLKVSEYME